MLTMSVGVSELASQSLCVDNVSEFQALKKTSAKYFYISSIISIIEGFLDISFVSQELKSSACKSQPDHCLLLGPFSQNWRDSGLII